MEFEECFGPATNGGCDGTRGRAVEQLSRELSSEEQLDRRRSYAKRDSSRINMLDRFERWCDLFDTSDMSFLFLFFAPI